MLSSTYVAGVAKPWSSIQHAAIDFACQWWLSAKCVELAVVSVCVAHLRKKFRRSVMRA